MSCIELDQFGDGGHLFFLQVEWLRTTRWLLLSCGCIVKGLPLLIHPAGRPISTNPDRKHLACIGQGIKPVVQLLIDVMHCKSTVTDPGDKFLRFVRRPPCRST